MTRTADRLAQLPPGLIDVHTHAIDPELVDVGQAHEGRFPSVVRHDDHHVQIRFGGRAYREVDSRCWSAAARLRDMDAEGVAAQVISPIPITLCHGEPVAGATALATAQNDFLAGLVADAPDRLFALGCVPLQDPSLAVAELVRCIDTLGFVGLEIGTRVGDRELTDPSFLPFFEAAAGLGAVLFVHPVDNTLDPRLARLGVGFGLGMPSETGAAAAALLVSDVLDQLPGLRLCLAHAGGTLPWVLPRITAGQRQIAAIDDPAQHASYRARMLWCDSLTYDVDNLALVAQRFTRAHVVLGTDYPFDAREAPAGAVLARAATRLGDVADIARENARALLSGVAYRQRSPRPVPSAVPPASSAPASRD